MTDYNGPWVKMKFRACTTATRGNNHLVNIFMEAGSLLGNTVKTRQTAFRLLTGNSDVRLLALLSSSGAPGNALAPVLVQTEDLLHLLPGDVNCHLHHRQRCKANRGRVVML